MHSKKQKGFTLVELIVVLIILAILAALLIPTLTGYIDKANEKKAVAETRMVVMAAQTVAGDKYAKSGAALATGVKTFTDDEVKQIITLAELPNTSGTLSGKEGFTITMGIDGQIKTVSYTNGLYNCYYAKGNGFATAKTTATPPTGFDSENCKAKATIITVS